jgi:3-deoxy-D-manno-octulosonate 8-phosphate phosphatase (KDO 8-P phosphatase)
MGTNLLRFAFWLDKGNLPPFAIISGENNAASHRFAKRERIEQCYFKFIDKTFAMKDFCQKNRLEPHEIAFVFDDVIDFSIAKQCGLRFLIRKKASPLTTKFAQENALCDYITACEGGEQAVREVCELLIGAKNLFDKTVTERMTFGDVYKRYVLEKNSGNTEFYTFQDGSVVPALSV